MINKMLVSVTDQLIDIQDDISDKIPFFEALKIAQQTDNNIVEIIELDLISSNILKLIIEHFKDNIKTEDLAEKLNKEYDQKIIERNLLYLGLNELYEAMYILIHGSTVRGKMVIYKVEYNTTRSVYDDILVGMVSDGREIDLARYCLTYYGVGEATRREPFVFEIFVDIEQSMILLTESEIKKVDESENMIKILDMFMMNYDDYIKHNDFSHTRYLKKLSKNYKSDDPWISVEHKHKKQKNN